MFSKYSGIESFVPVGRFVGGVVFLGGVRKNALRVCILFLVVVFCS